MLSRDATQVVIETLETTNLRDFAYTVASVLSFYDFLLTFSEEVKYIWRPKKTLVFFLFVCLRYGNLSNRALIAFKIAASTWTVTECSAILYVDQGLEVLIAGSMSAIFLLRCYAIWNRSRIVLGLLGLILSMKTTTMLLSLYQSFSPAIIVGPFQYQMACSVIEKEDVAIVETLNSAIVVVFDSLVLMLTLARSFYQGRRCCAELRKGLDYFILRDGLLYYTAVELLVLASIVLNQFPSQASLAQVVEILQPASSFVITQRLVLNLHQVSSTHRIDEQLSEVLTSFEFAHGTVIGNIGAPLRISMDDLIDEQAEEIQSSIRGVELAAL